MSRSFTVDGIRYEDPESVEEPAKPADQYRSTGKAEDSIALAVAEIVGLAIGSVVGTWGRRVFRALPDSVVVAVTLAVSLLYGLAEPGERRGERR